MKSTCPFLTPAQIAQVLGDTPVSQQKALAITAQWKQSHPGQSKLWNMEEFEAEAIIRVTSQIERCVTLDGYIACAGNWLPRRGQNNLKADLNSILPYFKILHLSTLIAPCERLISAIDLPDPTEAKTRAQCLHEQLWDELRRRTFFLITPEKLHFYTDENPFDRSGKKDVSGNFPAASGEGREAAKCFALDQPTACVFHLMRVLEIALRVFSMNGLKIPDPTKDWERNWRKILDKIKNIIDINNRVPTKKAPPGWIHPSNWKADKDFYENGYAFFEAVRNPWRNSTMHIERDYNEHEAKDIFNSVSTLMRHLATKLKE